MTRTGNANQPSRPLLAVSVAAAAALAFWVCYAAASWVRSSMMPEDDLAWLRNEFGLSAQEMSRIRGLHDGYLPECRERCARIEAKDLEIADLLHRSTGMTPELEARLKEGAALRAECQTQMLRHFYEVSRAMPPEQGRRYLEEMQRLTLAMHSGHVHPMTATTNAASGHVHH